MSTPSDLPRSPLGLPAGSIRGLLSLQIVITCWLLLLVPEHLAVVFPLNLYFLLCLVMVFVVSHGNSIARKSDPAPSPLYLPGGTLRLLIIGGTIASVVYTALNYPSRFDRLSPGADQMVHWLTYLACLAGGFTFGLAMKIMPFRNSWGFQTFQAWLALLSMGSLLLETILQVFVKTTIVQQLDFLTWQCIVTAVVAAYFGSRS
jgi:hypothetical protein